jgi:hypothetical protein
MDNDHTQQAPDSGSAGDVSTTGVSSHEAAGSHDQGAHAAAGDAHDAHGGGGHGGHGVDTSDVPTIVPVGFAQLILPAVILIIVAILVAGPLFNAFATRPPAAPTEPQATSVSTGEGSGATTPQSAGAGLTPTVAPTSVPATLTPQAAAPTQPPVAQAATAAPDLGLVATQTAVAVAGSQGVVARIPTKLEFEGATFNVAQGTGLVPDWKPQQDPLTATWIANTVANHILYVAYSDHNQSLFKAAKPGDIVKLTMNTGQVFEFSVTLSNRAVNGPATAQGQLTVNDAMSQDHAGVTLFLAGDPAADRAVVEGNFTGNITN